MKFFLSYLLLIIFSTFSQSQDIDVDSLLGIVHHLPEGEEKAKVYKDLVYAYHYEKPELAHHYLDTLLELSRKINYEKGVCSAYYLKSATFNITGDYGAALTSINQAKSCFESLAMIKNISSCTTVQGNIYTSMGLYEKAIEAYLEGLEIGDNLNDTLGVGFSSINLGVLFLRI